MQNPKMKNGGIRPRKGKPRKLEGNTSSTSVLEACQAVGREEDFAATKYPERCNMMTYLSAGGSGQKIDPWLSEFIEEVVAYPNLSPKLIKPRQETEKKKKKKEFIWGSCLGILFRL